MVPNRVDVSAGDVGQEPHYLVSIPSSPLSTSLAMGRLLILFEPQYLHLGLETINACLLIRM